MSIIRPFSSSEISNLREIIEKNGFKINGKIDKKNKKKSQIQVTAFWNYKNILILLKTKFKII